MSAVTLRLPATSANLGPGFDALGLAMDFALHVEAGDASETTIRATGRNVDVVERLGDSLILETYRSVLREQGVRAPELELTLRNEIPLGMGCGSSAAALVAGVALAVHFGRLGWSRQQVLVEASRREGHPDNVAACVLGGLTASAMQVSDAGGVTVQAVVVPSAVRWPLLIAMPKTSLSTKTARALLPEMYSRVDAVANVQAVALLAGAFATGRGDLLQMAMGDRMHQPYRAPVCPLLPALLPFAGRDGILGVALSGAGPSVLLILREDADAEKAHGVVASAAESHGLAVEVVTTRVGVAAELGLPVE